MRKALSLAFLFSLAAVVAAADKPEPRPGIDNWPSWRGPTANGIAPPGANPPTTWDSKTNIKWKVEIPGRGNATPIVWGNQVFVVTSIKTDREAKPEELPKPDARFPTNTSPPKHFYRFEVISFDRNTGKMNWRKIATEAVPHEGHHETHSYAGGSPTTDGKRLYVSFGSFGIYAYDLGGELLWKRDFRRLNSRFGWGEAVTPVVHGDSLVLNWDQEADSKLTVLDVKTGKSIGTSERLPGVTSFYASPVAAGDRLYFADLSGTTVVVKADDLTVLATNKLNEPIESSPVIVGKTLFLRGEKHLYAIE